MNVAIITPHSYPLLRGNAVTVNRIARYLGIRGCRIKVFSLDTQGAVNVSTCAQEFTPRLIHAFHAYHGGRVARLTAKAMGIPYIITLTGSDIYEALLDLRKEETHAVLREASALVTFHKSVKVRITEHFPTLAEKIFIIPQGVEPPRYDLPLKKHPLPEGKFIFLLPAGLRPVKNILFPLLPLAEIYRREAEIEFIVAGPVLDPGYAAEVLAELDRYPFAHYVGSVSHETIGCLYRKACVVLNTSRFEGGMANSVLEALSYGRAVLASHIDGNRSVIEEGVTGLLYRDRAEFQEKAYQLLTDEQLRGRLGEQGRRMVLDDFRAETEADAYLELYDRVLAGKADSFLTTDYAVKECAKSDF